jgi:hypothetical protein
MKTTRLRKVQFGTLIALMLYVVLVSYMFLVMPIGQPKWNNGVAERRIQNATSMEELQRDLRSAVSSLSTLRHSRNELLFVCFVAGIGMIGFLGWSLFMMERVKREDSIDRAI